MFHWRKQKDKDKNLLLDSNLKKIIKDVYDLLVIADNEKDNSFLSNSSNKGKERKSVFLKKKMKVNDYLKQVWNNNKNLPKIEMKTLIIFLAKNLHQMLKNLIESIKQIEKEREISPNFFSRLLIDVFFEKNENLVKNEFLQKNFDNSFVNHLILILNYAKQFDCMDQIQSKENDLNNLLQILITSIHFLSKIKKTVEQVKILNDKFIKLVLYSLIPKLTFFSFELIEGYDTKNLNNLLEQEDDLVRDYFSDICQISSLRTNFYFFFLKIFTVNKENNFQFIKYIEENKCLEMILTIVTNIYLKKRKNNPIFTEMVFLLYIYSFYHNNNLNEIHSSFRDKAFNLLSLITEFILKNDYKNFETIMSPFFNQIILIDFTSKDYLKGKLANFCYLNLTDNEIESELNYLLCDVQNEKFEKSDMLNIFLDLYNLQFENDISQKLRKTVLSVLFKDISIIKYKFILANTNFIQIFVDNLYLCNEEIIVRYFNILVFLYDQTSPNDSSSQANKNLISQEITSVIKSLSKISNDTVLSLFLKQLRTFLDISSIFQNVICCNGLLFKEVKNILDSVLKSEFYRPFELENDTKSNHSTILNDNYNGKDLFNCSMLEELIDFMELLLINSNNNINKDNYFILKQTGILDCSYYVKFAQHDNNKSFFIHHNLSHNSINSNRNSTLSNSYSKYYPITYKLWSIASIYEINEEDDSNEKGQIYHINSFSKRMSNFSKNSYHETKEKNINFIIQRYKKVKEDLLNYLTLSIGGNDEKEMMVDFALNYVKEILKIIEIIGTKFYKCKKVRTKLENELGEKIIIDFPNLIKEIKNLFYGCKDPSTEVFDLSKDLNNKNELIKFWNIKYQKILMQYFSIIIIMIANSNKDVFIAKFRYSKDQELKTKMVIPINKKQFIWLLKSIFDLIKENEKESDKFIVELIKYLIDFSIKTKNNSNVQELNDNYSLVDFYYKKFSIEEEKLNQIQKSISQYNNLYLHNPFIIISLLKALFKDSKKYQNEIYNLLSLIHFYLLVNDSNKKNFINLNLVHILFKFISKNEENLFNNKNSSNILTIIEKIIVTTMKMFSTSDVEKLFTHLLMLMQKIKNEIVYQHLEKIINFFFSNLLSSQKKKHSILLSNINTKQPGIYNMLYSSGIKFSSKNYKILSSQEKNSHSNCLCVLISLKFFNFDTNTNFILFKLVKNAKDKSKDSQIIEISIYKNCLYVKEGENDISKPNHNISNLIPLGKSSKFLIILYQNKIEIFLNGNNIYMNISNFHALDVNSNKSSYNFILGYPGPSTKELNNENSFESLSHISLSYISIFTDLISNDFSEQFSLSKISSSKNGSIRQSEPYIKYLNYNPYKTLLPTYNYSDSNNCFLNLNFNMDKSRIIYECIMDKVEVLSNKKLNLLKNDSFFVNNFLSKIQRKYYMDITDKDFLLYIPNTNYYHKNKISNFSVTNYTQHTFLLSKNNFSDLILMKDIYTVLSAKNSIKYKDFCITPSLDYSITSFNFFDFILMLINCLSFKVIEKGVESEEIIIKKKELLYQLLRLFALYLTLNLSELKQFSMGESSYKKHFQSFIIILSKIGNYLTKKTIDIFIFLSYGLIKEIDIELFDPWYPQFITEILLDVNFFISISNDNKEYIISTLKKTTVIPSMINDPDYKTRLLILRKLYHILLSVESSLYIDTKITELITNIISQMFKCRKGVNEVNDNILCEVIQCSLEYLKITDVFSQSLSCHLEQRNFTNEEINETNEIIKRVFEKLYTEDVKHIRKIIAGFFNKLYDDFFIITDSNLTANSRSSVSSLAFQLNQANKALSLLSPIVNYSGDYVYEEDTEHMATEAATKSMVKDISLSKSIMVQSNANNKNKKNNMKTSMISTDNNNSNSFISSKSVIQSNNGMETNNNVKVIGGNGNNNFANIQSQCTFCNYLLSKMKEEYESIKHYLTYKKYVKNFLYNLSVKNDRNEKIENFLKNEMNASFSYYTYKREGVSRILNRVIKKIDSFSNEELTKEYYDKLNNEIQCLPQDKFYLKHLSFFGMKEKLKNIIFLDEIFNLKFVSEMTETNDIFDSVYNCLLFNGLDSSSCVLILGKYKVYIMKNVHVDKNGILYLNGYEESFKKYFWSLNDYKDEWEKSCIYLNMKDNEQNKATKLTMSKLQSLKFCYKKSQHKIYSFSYKSINEMHKKKFTHQNNAIEIFLKNGKSFFFAVNKDKRDFLFSSILSNIQSIINISKQKTSPIQILSNGNALSSQNSVFIRRARIFLKKHKGKIRKNEPGLTDIKAILDEAQEKWSIGLISNYDYLMLLNTLSGRTYNDLSQYPIFPWILKDYTSTDGINLNNDEVYRNLTYPIFAQDKKSRDNLQIKYENADKEGMYHSGTHYSSPGFVAYFLIRTKPYSIFESEIQGGYFDTPDRLFSNIKFIWEVNEKYEELIPQMYFFPELFINYNKFNFGVNQYKGVINDVELPLWSCEDPRLFVKMKKKAIESCFSSQKLSDWIDLVFGYKQNGKEAVEYYNTFREACYPFDPNSIINKKMKEIQDNPQITNIESEKAKIYEELEYKMNEICEMGQNPLQLFIKPHIKKERHQKNLAFFSKCAFLMNLKPKEKDYKIKLNSYPNDLKGKHEITYNTLSKGEGGYSSFRCFVSDNSNIDPNANKSSKRNLNYFNTFYVVGKRHLLIGPKYQNYIDYSKNKYSFQIIKPFDKVIMEFETNENSPINEIQITRDGKNIFIAYQNGKISKYKIKKEKEETLIHPEYEKKHKDINNYNKKPSKLSTVNNDGNSNDGISNSNQKQKRGFFSTKTIRSMFSHGSSSNTANNAQSGTNRGISPNSNVPQNEILIKKQSNDGNNKINEHYSPQIEKNQNIIYPTIYFSSLNPEEFNDYFIHYSTQEHPKIKKDFSKGIKYYMLKKIVSTKIINSPIMHCSIMESFSTLIIIDITNTLYLFSTSSLTLLHMVPLSFLFTNPIKYINYCPYSGDFTLATQINLALFNINCVILAYLDIQSEINNGSNYPINSCLIQSLKSTESDIYLFTGHSNGCVILWKLENQKNEDEFGNKIVSNTEEFIDSYRFRYNTEYYNQKKKNNYKYKINFDKLFMIECKDCPIKMMKLTEDLSGLIVINSEMNLFCLSYEENFENTKKKTKQSKTCPQCSAPVGNSKICCVLCTKKLCSYCKIEQKIPECSLKNPKPICEDCLKMISSSNKMLYDF